jgi:hypothetical protein
MAMTNTAGRVPVRELILVPAIITLAVTLMRLAGELMGGPNSLFNRAPGGPLAIVGIVWLVPLFGYWFGHKLTRAGFAPPSLGRFFGFTVLAAVVFMGFAYSAARLVPPISVAQLVLLLVGSWAAAFIVRHGWRALGSTLIAYGLAARIPVAILMFIAIAGDWGTHYDVAPPNFPPGVGKLAKWVSIGLVPQLTVWIGITVVLGALLGGLAAAINRRRGTSHAVAA